MEYFREIEKLTSSNASGWIAASMNLSPLRLFGFMLASPFGVVTQVALDSRYGFG